MLHSATCLGGSWWYLDATVYIDKIDLTLKERSMIYDIPTGVRMHRTIL